MYLDPQASFERVLYVVCNIEERERKKSVIMML